MKEIELTQGKRAIVDDEDFELLKQWNWYARKGRGDCWYAVRGIWDPKIQNMRRIWMHRVIMDAKAKQQVDHKDRNGLNNRRRGPDGNLRFCTHGQNAMNKKKRIDGVTSPYKGVGWHKPTGKWRAAIKFQGKEIHLGLFIIESEAALAYNKAAQKHFGEFARVNVIGVKP